MDNWLFYALLSPAVYAVNNFIDKLVLEKYIKNYLALPIFSSFVGFIFGVIFWIITGFPVLSFLDASLMLVVGAFLSFGVVFYFRALSKEETSLIIILFQSMPIFVFLLSWIFLGETISIKQFIGFILILIASVGASLEFNKKQFKLSGAFKDILIANILWSISSVVFKFVSDSNNFFDLISFESFGLALGGLLLYIFSPSIKKAFHQSLLKTKQVAFTWIIFNESLFILAKLLGYYAISLGSVALVTVIGSTQVFFGIIYGFILTLIAPKIFKETIAGKGLSQKIIMGGLAFIGIFLIS